MSFIRQNLPPTLHNAAGTIIAALVVSVAGPAAYGAFTTALAADRQMVLHWLYFILLACCVAFALFQVIRWMAFSLRSEEVRLFRRLSRNEKTIIKRLAESEYGLTEWEVSQAVPVSTQHFLHFIDRLVTDLHLAERTVQPNGGAFWTLSDRGRKVAVTNRLFPRAGPAAFSAPVDSSPLDPATHPSANSAEPSDSLSPQHMIKTVAAAAPLARDHVKQQFIDLPVEWRLPFSDTRKLPPDHSMATVYFLLPHSNHEVRCELPLNQFPFLRVAREGEEFSVQGIVADVSSVEVVLRNVTLTR